MALEIGLFSLTTSSTSLGLRFRATFSLLAKANSGSNPNSVNQMKFCFIRLFPIPPRRSRRNRHSHLECVPMADCSTFAEEVSLHLTTHSYLIPSNLNFIAKKHASQVATTTHPT